MTKRQKVLGAVLALIILPAMLAIVEAATFFVRNHHDGTIVSSGETREFVLHVPDSYDPTRPIPLVISMHGAGGWGALQMRVSGWNRLADEKGFIVVYPSALKGGGPRVWGVERSARLTKDVRFISDLIKELEAQYHIDPSRIYANGLSNGGGMSFVLSCTLSDRIAAVGMVGSAQTLPWSWCNDNRPIPMINFHGTADPLVPYEGGSSWAFPIQFPDVREWTASWARRNRCEPQPVVTRPAEDVARFAYIGCADDASVVLYAVEGGGHTWPGGEELPEWFAGRTSGFDANTLMWEFFLDHPLRGAQTAARHD